ncbi:gliding motility-associated C-terminal domain-containing protein [Mucilaginibacter robiniae]|uniref:Gliding motility-associated C-terminal domain-containing protein n=1 Tax=Mucilaginibacter robiniae TaxID=2728022 RepID=A0A7L5E9C4_9SPHI|nr:gliding motility-associated C-terminal domain-containing protein [Mucilaginibacter robiniae]QJD96986.1 gliding motility-associated C-terminal domain-containing protein [Mucilaginibacter robiniae]
MKIFTSCFKYILLVIVITLFTTFYATAQRTFAGNQQSGRSGLLCANCVVTGGVNAADGNLQTYSVLNVSVGLLAQTWQELIFTNTSKVPGGTPVTIKLGSGNSLLSLQALGAISLRPYNGSTPVGGAIAANTLLTALSNNNQVELSLTPASTYDRVRVTLDGGIAGALSNIYLYDAFYKSNGTVACNTAFDELHGISAGLLGLGLDVGGVINPQNAIDGNLTTASTLNAGVGLVGAFAQQTAVFNNTSTIGDSVRLTLSIPQGLIDAGVLSNISVATYNGNTPNNDEALLNSALLNVRLLDLANSRRKVTVTYAPSAVFDRVQLRLGGGIANVLSTLDLYEIQRLIPRPMVSYNGAITNAVQLCAGNSATLTAAPVPNTTFNWYTQATGGTPVFTGPTFTTPALSTTTTYYAEAVRNGCTDASERTPVAITVSQTPVAPVFANANVAICSGQTATFAANVVEGGVMVSWYTAPTGGTPVFKGNSFTTGPLTQTTSFYAEAVSGGQCVSPTRTQVTATVTAAPANPVSDPATVTICEGEVATLSVTNPQSDIQYNWYSTATGGTALYSGSRFTTPALNTSTNYYIEAINSTGCSSSQRALVSVNVQSKPADPVLVANSSTISAGQSATINVSNAETGNTYNWYTSATAATPVYTGVIYQTPALYANTTYYVNAVSSAGCTSVNRTPVTIQVNINNNTPCSFANQQTSTINGVCIGCDIDNRALAVDADTTTASTIRISAGLTGGYAEQELRFQQAGFAGDTIKLVLQTPVGLADANVLSQIEVALYNGTNQVSRYALNNALIQVRALGSGNRYVVYIPATGSYDRLTIRLNSGLAGLLTSLQVYYAAQQFTRPVINPANPEICKGSTAQLNITAPSNGTFSWYTTPTGGTPVYTGTNFTTPALNAKTTYYIEYARNSCVSPVRYPVQVLVDDVPAAPTVASNNVTITSGQTATLTATPPANATIKWYTSATGGTPVATGNTFTTPALTANTTYYAEAASGSCVSATRTPVNVTVNPVVIPDVAVNPPTQAVNPGQTATFTASSTTPGVKFNWYTAATGGTPIFTGATFTTPAEFANTTFYVEAVVPSTGAVSSTRATASVTINPNAANPVACDAAMNQTTDINGVVCLGCTVANTGGSVDNDRNTFSQLQVPVGLVNAYALQTLRFAGTGHAGDSVVVELGMPGSLADVNLLSRIALATYNGNTYNNDRFSVNGSLLNVTLLNGQSRFRIAFVAQHDFDRVEVRLNSAAAGALTALNIYDAAQEVAAPVITTQNTTACQGSQATLTATVPDGVTVRWYTSATGGAPVATGTTFTTPALDATTMYYAEASRAATNCPQVVRTPATVTVTPVPSAPQVNTANVTVCSGQPASFTAQATNGTTINWYNTPTGGTPVFTGTTFTTGPLTTTTSYYAEATVNGQCSSATRTQVTANVNDAVTDPTVAQTQAQVCSGSSTILTASSAQAGVTFNWYTSATGGTPVFTGAQFTTPALTANTTYYVEAASGSCVSANRVRADVMVNPVPAAPTVASNPSGGQITSGQTATLTASSTTSGATFNWYTTATGGTPVFTGNSFTTPVLTSTTTYYVESTSPATGCVSATRTPVTVTVNPVFSTLCDFASTQTTDVNGGLTCINCTITTPDNAVDVDTTNFSRLNIGAGVAGSYVAQNLKFSEAGSVGDTVSVLLRFPANIASVGVLDRVRIASYNGGTYNNDGVLLNSNTVRVQLLPGGQTALVRFAPQSTFDRVEIRLNSALAGLLNSVDVFYASKQVEAPQLTATTANICSGSMATFKVNNARTGVIYNWYTQAIGGKPVFTGPTFTTPALTATTTYYVESARSVNSCPNPNRVTATVNVTPTPVNAVLAQSNVQACAGSPVTISITNANGATVNWYDAPTGGNLVFTGADFQTSPVATISYYAELTNGTCTSPARTQATVTVNPRPAAPGLLTANTEVCAGSSATLQVLNPETGVNYEWFTAATGGTPVFTGASFTTPALTQNTTYYVQATNATSGCINNGGRTQATITVSEQIGAPTLSATQTQVCIGGSTAISVVNPVAGLQYNWYTTATGGNAVFTGTTFPLNNLTANATYYVEAVSSKGCVSAARTSTSITVKSAPVQPQVQASGGSLTICAGSTTSLSITNPQANLTYRWFDAATGGTLLYTGTQFTTPALTVNTTYYVEAAEAGNCNPSARTAVTITVTNLPADAVLTSANVNICAGSTATFKIASPQTGVTYQWFDSPARTRKVFEGTTFVTGPLTANTTFYVSAVNTGGCNSANLTTAQVSIQQAPSAPVIANGNSVQTCSGTRVTLNIANPEASFTYNWYSQATGGTPVFTGTAFTTPTLPGNITYYVEAVNTTGCISANRTTVNISVNPLPAVPVVTGQGGTASPSACVGSSTTLTATSTAANVTFNWYNTPTGGTPVFTGANFTTPALTANVTYYVETVDNTTGCVSVSRAAVTVTVSNLPASPTLTNANVIVCSGSTATLTISSPQAGMTYQWFDSPARTNKVFEGTTFVTGPITANTTYYVAAVNASGCSSPNSTAAQVIVQQAPGALIIANGNNVQTCTGTQVNLSITNPQTGFTYNWYTQATGGTPIATGTSFTTGSLSSDVTYYVEAVNSTGCASATRTAVNVHVNAIPAVPTVNGQGGAASPSICSGSTATLNATSTTANVTFNWYTQATGGTPVFTGATFTTPVLTANTTYYVETVSNAGGCTSTTRTPVKVLINTAQATAPQINTADLTVCQNSVAILHITNPDAATTYNWYTTATATNAVYTGTAFRTPALSANTIYYVEAVSTKSCSPSVRVPVNVVVVPQPATPVLAANNVTVCAGSAATLSIVSPQQGITYNWYDSASQNHLLFTGASYTTDPITTRTTFYVNASNGSCNSSALASVQVNIAQPPIAPLVVSNNVVVCPGTQAVLAVANPQAGFTYRWYSSATGGSVLYTGVKFTTPQVNDNTTWYVEAENNTGCASATRTAVNVTLAPPPSAPQIGTAGLSVCAGSSTTLNATVADSSLTVKWYEVPSGGDALFTGMHFKTPPIGGTKTYYAEVTNAGGCSSGVRMPVTVQVPPPLDAPQVSVDAATSNSVTFRWKAVPGAKGYEISLDNGKTFTKASSGSTGLTHTVTGLQPNQNVSIIVKVSGESDCQVSALSTALAAVTENPMGDGMFIPNAFSPNGDGNNDQFLVYGTNIKTMTLWVYDQWGEMVFRSINQSTGWDGTYKGKQLPVGVYVYILEANMNDGQVVKKKGTINLLR